MNQTTTSLYNQATQICTNNKLGTNVPYLKMKGEIECIFQ